MTASGQLKAKLEKTPTGLLLLLLLLLLLALSSIVASTLTRTLPTPLPYFTYHTYIYTALPTETCLSRHGCSITNTFVDSNVEVTTPQPVQYLTEKCFVWLALSYLYLHRSFPSHLVVIPNRPLDHLPPPHEHSSLVHLATTTLRPSFHTVPIPPDQILSCCTHLNFFPCSAGPTDLTESGRVKTPATVYLNHHFPPSSTTPVVLGDTLSAGPTVSSINRQRSQPKDNLGIALL